MLNRRNVLHNNGWFVAFLRLWLRTQRASLIRWSVFLDESEWMGHCFASSGNNCQWVAMCLLKVSRTILVEVKTCLGTGPTGFSVTSPDATHWQNPEHICANCAV